MDIKFTELDKSNYSNNFDFNSYEKQTIPVSTDKYWNQEKQQKRKKVSFDDILSNMNLVVNNSGVLQFMTPNKQNEPYDEEPYYDEQYYDQPSSQLQKSQPQVSPLVKHSYIYNKYFKDYQNSITEVPTVRVPKTMEEYKQMLIHDKIMQLEQKKRISEIKSTKLLFTSNTGLQNMKPSKNNLRNMSFN